MPTIYVKHNVLMPSLNVGFQINAKLADYGISRYAGPHGIYGLKASEGTPGYRAPEVIRGENYGTQVSEKPSF